MTAREMNAELFRQLSLIAEDETMMDKVLKYLRSLTVVKKESVKVAKKKNIQGDTRIARNQSLERLRIHL